MGKGGEIFIFDMGKSVRIVDLAKRMISLSGLTLGKDIQVRFTGLRPGEKLYEELLNSKENTIPTHHPRILIAKVREYDAGEVALQIDDLIRYAVSGHDKEVVQKMKAIVPEFISQNSVYEELDQK
jgi:FlaA1/EpsC-like NDP-sugar epimerase